MKFKEIRENEPQKESKKPKKNKPAKKKKFEFKETIVHSSDYLAEKAKKAAGKVKQLRNETFAVTKAWWKPYALMIATYYVDEYAKNLDYLSYKFAYFNKKANLSQRDLSQMEILISLNELKYYIKGTEKDREIDMNFDLVNRDFFESKKEESLYKELIVESDKKFKHSISFLIKLFNLLITFVDDKKMRQVFYNTVISKEKREQKEDHHPVIINEKLIKVLPVKQYLSYKYKKKAEYVNEY